MATREGWLTIDQKRLFARFYASENRLVCYVSAKENADLVVECEVQSLGNSNNDEVILLETTKGKMQVSGETVVDTKAWSKLFQDTLQFFSDRANLLLRPSLPGHVMEALIPDAGVVEKDNRIHVKHLTGRVTLIDISPSETIATLKKMIEAKENIPAASQNIVYASSVCNDAATLSQLKISNDGIVFLIVKKGLVPSAAAVAAPSSPQEPTLTNDLLSLAKKSLKMGDYRGCLKVSNKYLSMVDPDGMDEVEARNVLGVCLKKQAKYDEAMEHFQRARDVLTKKQLEHGEVFLNMADVKRKQEKWDEASELYRVALAQSAKNESVLVEVYLGQGLIAKKFNRYDDAIVCYQEALKLSRNVRDAKWAQTTYNLADVYRKQEKLADAKRLYVESLGVIESCLGTRHAEVAEVCNSLGMLLKKEGGYAEASQYYERAVSIISDVFGDDHPKNGVLLVNIGDIARKLGNFAAAEQAYGRALPILEASLGRDHVEVADALNSQGLVLKKRAAYDEAEPLYVRAIDIVLKAFGTKVHYKFGIFTSNLADIFRKRGQYEQALALYEDALSSLRATLGENHSEVGEVLHNIGLVRHQLCQYQEAVTLFERAIAIVEKEFGASHYKVGAFKTNLGMSCAMLEDYARAHVVLRAALGILKAKLGPRHIEVADCLAYLGDVCMKLFFQMNVRDKLDEARQHYEEANSIVEECLGKTHPKSVQFASLLMICNDSAEQANKRDHRPIELVQVILLDVSGSMETKTALASRQVLDRREIAKVFFGAFIDKEIAYGMPHALGLVTFGDRVTVELDVTRDYESFVTQFGKIEALQPATHCWDAVSKAVDLLDVFCKGHAAELAPGYQKRILCLSDGEDSTSNITVDVALKKLLDHGVIFDSIPIEGSHNHMRGLSNASGGMCFVVKSYEEGVSLFEREALLSLRHRLPQTPCKGPVEAAVKAIPYQENPSIRHPQLLSKSRMISSPDAKKRLMQEMADACQKPFELIPGDDLSLWCILYEGPAGTPYENRFFILYADFGLGYPDAPPEVRFLTPIYHCQINQDGRICLDLLSASVWTLKTTMRQVMENLDRLLRSPNAYNAIDSVRGTLYRENRPMYLQNAVAHSQQNGFKSKADALKSIKK